MTEKKTTDEHVAAILASGIERPRVARERHPNSLANLAMGRLWPVTRPCKREGCGQWALKGRDVCRVHAIGRPPKGAPKRKKTPRQEILHQIRAAQKAGALPPGLTAHPAWREAMGPGMRSRAFLLKAMVAAFVSGDASAWAAVLSRAKNEGLRW